MRISIFIASVLVLSFLLSACGSALEAPSSAVVPDDAQAASDTTQEATATTVATPTPVPPTPTSAANAALLPEEAPPPGTFTFTTDFSRHTVPYSEILSGGPAKDGIAAVDEPIAISIDEADEWLEDREPVILVDLDGEARAYPIQILMWHEIVNDILGDTPVVVSFCPLCNTGIAFNRTVDGQVMDFGTTGRLRFSNLIMYDRQTESWWQQATGEGIVGELAGNQLEFLPASMISWADFKSGYPEGTVLSRETGHARNYGGNPYSGYDDINRSPFLYVGEETPDQLPPMARVLTVELNGDTVAYPYQTLKEVGVINDEAGGMPLVVIWQEGTASALNSNTISEGRDVGAANTFSRDFEGETLTFAVDGDKIVDEQTGSQWNVLGRAVEGPFEGSQLTPVVGVNHFWFSWAAFKPETRVYQAMQSENTTGPETSDAAAAVEVTQLDADFEINAYQGQDVLGGETVMFSELLAQGQPVVLNMWAGLCPTCRAELPHLQAAYEQYGDQVLIVGVDIGPFVGLGSNQDGIDLLERQGATYPAGSTPDPDIVRQYKVLGTPATYFFKPDGEIHRQWNGILTEDQLDQQIQALIEASNS